MNEGKGFKDEIGKKKAFNKQKKQDARTAKEKRERKLNDLVSSPKKWRNLESADIRTPSSYFQRRGETGQRLENIKEKLDDLLEKLHSMRGRGSNTPATERIIENEIARAEKKKRRKTDLSYANAIVNEISEGNAATAVALGEELLDMKAFLRIEPHLEMAGADIEEHVFPLYK